MLPFFALFSLEHGMSSGRIYIVICKKAMLHYKDSVILCLTLPNPERFLEPFSVSRLALGAPVFRIVHVCNTTNTTYTSTEPAVDVSKSTKFRSTIAPRPWKISLTSSGARFLQRFLRHSHSDAQSAIALGHQHRTTTG